MAERTRHGVSGTKFLESRDLGPPSKFKVGSQDPSESLKLEHT